MTLLDTPEFRKAVEVARIMVPPCGNCIGHPSCGSCTCRVTAERILLAALPFIRKALANELRAESERYQYGWLDAADFIEREGV